MNEPVSIIIVNLNGKRFLQKCLGSVLNQSYRNFELVFFDNNSDDGSPEFVRDNFKDERIRIIESAANTGYAGGCNEAVKHAANDLIVLLNNDTETERNWLKYLAEAVKEKGTIASSFVITQGIDTRYYQTNGSVSYCMYNVMNIFRNIEDVFYPNGCSLIFRKSEISFPFDSDYFYYSEDLYLGLKARFMGMEVKFARESVVRHLGGGTSSADSLKTFYRERNRYLNLYTFFSISFLIRSLPVISIVKTARLIQALFSGKHSFGGMLKAYLWFYFHLPTVLRKRNQLNKFKRTHENEIIRYMTSKLLNGESPGEKFINRMSYYYSRLVGLRPIEYYRNKPDGKSA